MFNMSSLSELSSDEEEFDNARNDGDDDDHRMVCIQRQRKIVIFTNVLTIFFLIFKRL